MEATNRYKINDIVWFISGTGSILPTRVRNVIIREIGNPVTYRDDYQVSDLLAYDRTEVTYDLSNDLSDMSENQLFSSAESAFEQIEINR